MSEPIQPLPDLRPRGLAPWEWLIIAMSVVLCGAAVACMGYDAAWSSAMPNIPQEGGGWFAELVRTVRPFGHGEVLVMVALALGAIGWRRVGTELLAALVLVAVMVWVLKFGVQRTRPTGEPYSFPSGDAATCAVLVPALLAMARPGARWWALLAGVLTISVAGARVVKGFHYPSDVMVGTAVGLLGGLGAHRLVRDRWARLPSRWFAIALAVVVVASCVGIAMKYHAGDRYPLLPPFLALAVPVMLVGVVGLRLRAVRQPWIPSWQVVVGGVIGLGGLLLVLATASTLWDRDETFYAQTAQEMITSGNLLVPTFNAEPFLHKPPLVYWLMAGTAAVFGHGELSFRVWSIIALVATLGLLALLARRLVGDRSRLTMPLLFGTMPLTLVVGGAATTDAVLLFFLVAALTPWFLAVAANEPVTRSSWSRAVLMGLAMGMGMLAKAPLGVAIPVATLVLARVLLGRGAPPLWRDLTIATVIAMGVYLAWAIPTNIATDGAWLREAIGKHIVGRAMAPMEGHGGGFWKSLPYYVPVIIGACLPWTALLPATISAWVGGRLGDCRLRMVVLAWFVPTFVLMSCVATKLPHYILPAVPAVALAFVALIAAAEAGQLDARDRRYLAAGRWILAGLCVPVGLGLVFVPWFLPVDDARAGIVGAGLVFAALPFLVWRSWSTRPELAVRVLAWGMVVFVAAAAVFALPKLEAQKPAPVVAAVVRATTASSVPVAVSGYSEPSLLFYLDRAPVPELDDPASLRAWAAAAGPGVLIITQPKLDEAQLDLTALRVLDRRHGFDLARGRWLDLVTLGRNLPKP